MTLMGEIHSNPYTLITSRIDNPIVHVQTGPSTHICCVKDIPEKDKVQSRAGVIIYTIRDGRLYFCLGIDTNHDAYTDFSGGIKQTEDTISGAHREFIEESLNVFGNISKDQINNSLALYSENMMTIFIYVNCDMDRICSIFEKSVRFTSNPEVKSILWLPKMKFLNIINKKDPSIMYHKLYDLFLMGFSEYGDIFSML